MVSSSFIRKEKGNASPLYSGSGSFELRLLIRENVTPSPKISVLINNSVETIICIVKICLFF